MNLRLEIETPLRDSITAAKLLDEQIDAAFSPGGEIERQKAAPNAIYFLIAHLLANLRLIEKKWNAEDEK